MSKSRRDQRQVKTTYWLFNIFPQIAIAIGVLTSNRGEGDEPLCRIGRGTRVPLQGAIVGYNNGLNFLQTLHCSLH